MPIAVVLPTEIFSTDDFSTCRTAAVAHQNNHFIAYLSRKIGYNRPSQA